MLPLQALLSLNIQTLVECIMHIERLPHWNRLVSDSLDQLELPVDHVYLGGTQQHILLITLTGSLFATAIDPKPVLDGTESFIEIMLEGRDTLQTILAHPNVLDAEGCGEASFFHNFIIGSH